MNHLPENNNDGGCQHLHKSFTNKDETNKEDSPVARTRVRMPFQSFTKIEGNMYPYDITKVTIPSDVIEIGNDAFRCFNRLKAIIFASDSLLKNIGNCAFWGCSLESITIPSSVECIGGHAFVGCRNLKAVVFALNSKLRVIGEYAFSGTPIEGSITIPSKVKEIGQKAFFNCNQLTAVVFEPNSELQRMGIDVFAGCSSLTLPEIPNNVEESENYSGSSRQAANIGDNSNCKNGGEKEDSEL